MKMGTNTQRNFRKQIKELEKQKDYKSKYYLYDERKPKKYRKIRNISISSVIIMIIMGYSLLGRINNLLHIPLKSFNNTENTLYITPEKNITRDFITTIIELRKTQVELIDYSNNISRLEFVDEEQIIETTYIVKDYLKTIHEYQDKLISIETSEHMESFKEKNISLIVSMDNYYEALLKSLLNPKEKEYRDTMSKEAKRINEYQKIINVELENIINDYNKGIANSASK